MTLTRMRRIGAPIAILNLSSFFLAMAPARPAHAEEAPAAAESAPPSIRATNVAAEESPGASPVAPANEALSKAALPAPSNTASAPGSASLPSGPAGPVQAVPPTTLPPMKPVSLPTGADKTGVSSQAISVPQGAGKIQGMGESFSAQLSTGIATFSVPFALNTARGAAQPSLGLSYSSSGGHGLAGVGWDVGVPYIARQTDRGLPSYQDPAGAWIPTQDRFVFNGGQELVPVCLVLGNGQCDGALSTAHDPVSQNEAMPDWAAGWQYFRPRVEGSFLRFFWSSDHKTWRVQDKSGVLMELGVAVDESSYAGALETNPDKPSQIFRWNLVRQSDSHLEPAAGDHAPRPLNRVVYRYQTVDGLAYLTDIYDTPPAQGAADAGTSKYAHHTRLRYESRPDVTISYRRGWRTASSWRLAGVDVTSKSFGDPNGDSNAARVLVRRYHLEYESKDKYHVSLLSKLQVEGRCTSTVAENSSEQLADATGCPVLPPMKFGYQHVTGTSDLPGYEPFDETQHLMASSPDHSIDEQLTDLFDVNSDGLPDVVVTAPGLYGGNHGVFFNGSGGKADSFGAATIGVTGVPGATASVISLDNDNVSPQDLDGDGTIDLLHMPKVKTYSVYTPVKLGTGWWWKGQTVDTASQQNAKIDFGQDTLDLRVMDVNGDGLVDVVHSAGTQFETFFALGRLPGGWAQFGHGSWSGKDTANLSNDAITMCVPWSGLPIRFSDSDIKLADMNGDGLVDIVRLHQGDVRYWPGRGNGLWGTGKLDNCPGGTFGSGRDLQMAESPQYSDLQGESLRLDDVNGDGLDDLVQVRFSDVDVWLNVDGTGWTDRHTIHGTPPSPSYANRVRLVDMNGSGTRDILWGDGNKYRYIDLSGGKRPWVLTHVSNGLGKTTDLEYASSTELMLSADTSSAKPGDHGWSSVAPMPLHVVRRVTESDNLDLVGRPAGKYVTEYTYASPVYDGRQRELRGFKHAEVKRIGDANSPTSTTTSDFLLGECVDDGSVPNADVCSKPYGWYDNPREALKGLPTLSEVVDEQKTYVSTAHHTYTLRKLYSGKDGRSVWHAFESSSDMWMYDTAPFVKGSSSVTTDDVVGDASVKSDVPMRGAKPMHTQSASTVDFYGNATSKVDYGCHDGCTKLIDGSDASDEVITTETIPDRPQQGDPTGWLWRTVETKTSGSKATGIRHHTKVQYSAQGDPIVTSSELAGTLDLDRAPAKQQPAPPPADRSDPTSEPRWIDNVQIHDDFGNVTWRAGPNARCDSVNYDSTYAQLAIDEIVYVGTDYFSTSPKGRSVTCGKHPLLTSARYDRGLALVTDVSDLHGEPTHVEYDEFGRLKALTRPSPYVGYGDDWYGPVLSGAPSVKIDYSLPSEADPRPYSRIHTQTQDGPDHDAGTDADYQNVWGYVDGLGRTIVTVSEAEDAGNYIANGLTEYDNKGAARRAYLAWSYAGPPDQFPLASVPPSPYGRQRYDAFGRQIETYGLDGTITLRSAYHALAQDKWEAADIAPGEHHGTYASARSDGHGRAVEVVERVRAGTGVEPRSTLTDYLPTGEVTKITRQRNTNKITRWMSYDSLGRRVLNVEPSTSTNGASQNPGADPSSFRAWRYAYNDAGDLVGTSDARGCGANYSYDAGGRLLAEDYSPCEEHHRPYLSSNGTPEPEVIYHYDDIDGITPPDDFPVVQRFYDGRLAWVADRGAKTLSRYDGRGRATGVARQIAKPHGDLLSMADRYASDWFIRKANFDGADRPVRESTGAAAADLLGGSSGLTDGTGDDTLAIGNTSAVTTEYTARGTVKKVSGSYGDLVVAVQRDADGLVHEIHYGDHAATKTSFGYDDRRRLRTVQTYRGPPESWKTDPAYSPTGTPTFQLLLQDDEFTYDAVDNPTEIHDWRSPSEWPAGAKPVSRKIKYDDLYRVTQVDYQYPSGDDDWTSPFAAENAGDVDPRRAQPVPQIAFDKRVERQTFQYDWLGNTTQTDDDAHGFYDRSLGTITTDVYRIVGAANDATSGASTRIGHLSAGYDDAGNLTSLEVVRHGTCLPATASGCSQWYSYQWDEVGRLVDAKRRDEEPTSAIALAHLAYAYDANDARVLKTAVDDVSLVERHTVYAVSTLELRRAAWDDAAQAYERTAVTEAPYLMAHGVRLARVEYEDGTVPEASGAKTHVMIELGDHLGSTGTVIDKATGELVEKGTYLPYGAAESDYRPGRWASFREDYRFTGKEEDVEVGLQYFGKRFLSPQLGRWVSADPLAVHAPGQADEDDESGGTELASRNRAASPGNLNPYAYIESYLLGAVDDDGLQPRVAIQPWEPPRLVEIEPEKPRFSRGWITGFKPPAPALIGAAYCNAVRAQMPVVRLTSMGGEGAPNGGWVLGTFRELPKPSTFPTMLSRRGNPVPSVERHHFVPETIAQYLSPTYNRESQPAILMSTPDHNITRANWNTLNAQLSKIDPDWVVKAAQSPELMKMVAEALLKGTSLEGRTDVKAEAWKQFETWRTNGQVEQELKGYESEYNGWKANQVKFEQGQPDDTLPEE